MGIGARLREAREVKGITLDELQDTTKIQKRYLVAIEEENFSVLPGKFYAKAFIKEYALAVDLDPIQLMEEYKEDIPSPEEDTTTQYTRIHRSRKDNMPTKSNAIFSFIPTLIVIILIIGIIFLAWWFITKSNEEPDNATPIEQIDNNEEFYRNENVNRDTEDGTEDAESEQGAGDNTTDQDESETEQEELPEQTELQVEVIKQGSGAKPESELELTNVGEELTFEFIAEARVWLDVTDDKGEVFFSGFVTPEESLNLDLSGKTRIFLNVGSAPNLTININDSTLEYPVDPTQRGADHQKLWLNVAESNE